MSPLIKNILAVLAGILIGSIVNMAIITLSPFVIAPPAGTDVITEEGLKAAMPLFEPKHFIMPFLAHALGTFVGAYLAAFIAASHKAVLAYSIGALFLMGGLSMVFMLPSPLWFSILDIGGAYIPLAFLAVKLNK